MVQASAVLRSSRKDPLHTLISYSKATKVRSLKSGHENPELSDATLQVHIIKPNGVHTGTRVHDQVMWSKYAGVSNNK